MLINNFLYITISHADNIQTALHLGMLTAVNGKKSGSMAILSTYLPDTSSFYCHPVNS